MRKAAFVLPVLFFCCTGLAQHTFITRVKQVVERDESFQVQFSLTTADDITAFSPPSFTGFEVKRGPDITQGVDSSKGKPVPVRTYFYTLQPTKTGRFTIRHATAIAGSKQVKSNDVAITVVTKPEKTQQPLQGDTETEQLLPGEDPGQKIKQNIFLTAQVDRTTCYAGEPLLATFKLSSRLESKSEIVKYPGFYGFTVLDVVNLGDQKVLTETINGKQFDVHTIRQVQLYPLQAGTYTIDPMEVRNEVTFSKSGSVKQEITETGGADAAIRPGKVYENNISTSPVTITVKPVPLKGRPADFNGAVGLFNITSKLSSNRLAKNEGGFLDLTISGRGNFTQLIAPGLNWPTGVEGFEPVITDSLNKEKIPMEGSRTFRYSFISSTPGNYVLPAVSFSYFNPAIGGYRSVYSSPQTVEISKEVNRAVVIAAHEPAISTANENTSRIAFIIIISLITAGLAYWIFFNKKKAPEEKEHQKVILPVPDEVLKPARDIATGNTVLFLTTLYHGLWKYFEGHLALPGVSNKDILYKVLDEKNVPVENIQQLRHVFSSCEAGMFAGADLQPDRELLLQDAADVIEAVNKKLL